MLNVIKMDFYRMRKSKTTWFILLGVTLMMLGSVFMTKHDINYYTLNPPALEAFKNNLSEVNWGLCIGKINPNWCNGSKIPLNELISLNLKSKLSLMFLVIFVVYFAENEIKTGFIKNIAGQVKNRRELIFSKFTIIVIYSALLVVTEMLSVILASKLFLGYVNFEGFQYYLPFVMVEILLHTGYGMFILLLVLLTKSAIFSLISGILISSGILEIVDVILLFIFPSLKNVPNFSIMNYFACGNIGLLSVNSNTAVYIKAFLIAISVTVIMEVICSVIMEKQDIN